MQKIKYTDLHCDTLTVCADKGADLFDCRLQTNFENLIKSGCAAQCFAVFTEGENAAEDFERYIAFYNRGLERYSDFVSPVKNSAELDACVNEGKLGCILTVENLGFAGGKTDVIPLLKKAGVSMASLVWNYENEYAHPNLLFENGIPIFEKRCEKRLKDAGRLALEALDKSRIIIDISHLSDGGAEEILNGRKIPVTASHSNACAVHNVSRNLTDGLIKKIADCGGITGINFCNDFLGGNCAPESVLRHLKYIINFGGEDCAAIGSDFDGIPVTPLLEDCSAMPRLFEYLNANGLNCRVLEKIAFGNFYRVFKEICG